MATKAAAKVSQAVPDGQRDEQKLLDANGGVISTRQRWADMPHHGSLNALTETPGYVVAAIAHCVYVMATVSHFRPFLNLLVSEWRRLAPLWVECQRDLMEPSREIWNRLDSIAEISRNAKPPERRRLNPVETTLRHFGDAVQRHLWTARAYGRFDSELELWVGPFFVDGNVSSQLIEQEAREPGSVLPPEFDPDAGGFVAVPELITLRADMITALEKIAAGRHPQQQVQRGPVSRTIESMLTEGMTVEQVARLKQVSTAEVLRVAELSGVAALLVSDYQRPVDEEADDEFGDRAPIPSQRPARTQSRKPATTANSETESPESVATLDAALRELYERDPDINSPSALSELRKIGISSTPQIVGGKLSAMRRGAPVG